MEKPTLIIIGGANGSGKTTLAREFVAREKCPYLGADEIARELNPLHPEKVNVEAARLFSQKLNELLEKRESFIVESTLSGLTLQNKIMKARSFNYTLKILFVYLSSPELCVQRVAARVAKGGHDVPVDHIKRRFVRAEFNFWNVYRHMADEWSVFCNDGDKIFQVKEDRRIIGFPEFRVSSRYRSERIFNGLNFRKLSTFFGMPKDWCTATTAVSKALEENRQLGVPNWYLINGVIINEAELNDKNKSQK